MIAHPPLSSMKNNSKLNNIRKKNYTKKKTSTNEPKKKLSEIEKLEMENQEMEQRLLELKHNLAKEKEKRLKQGKTSFWQSGKKGVLFNHGNEVIYNKNLNQMKNKNSIYGMSLQNSSSGMLKNKEMFDPMRYLNLNNNRKSTLNLISTSSSTQKSESHKKTDNKNPKSSTTSHTSTTNTTTTTNNINNKFNTSSINTEDIYTNNNDDGNIDSKAQIEIENDENNDIVFKKKAGGLFNFNKYLDTTTDHLNSINISSDDKTIIKSKYDEAMKNKSLTEPQTEKVSSGINTSYEDDYISHQSNSFNHEQHNDNSRLIDGEFNEEESHNSFIEALNMWRKERREQESLNSNNEKKIKPRVTFADNFNSMNTLETQTKELNNALNMDEIIKNLKESKSNLSYMERLALYKYREQYKKEMQENQKPKSVIVKQDCEVIDIDEDEIDAAVEKYWEDNNKESDNEVDFEKEIQNNINTYVNQYKMKQLELYKYNKNKNVNNKSKMNNTKTSVYIEDSFSEDEEDANAVIEYNDISPIVDEPDEN